MASRVAARPMRSTGDSRTAHADSPIGVPPPPPRSASLKATGPALEEEPGRWTSRTSRGNVLLAKFRTLLSRTGTLLSEPAGTFPGRSHQLQPLVEPQPSQT
jgi:hypothetical protein